MNFTIRQGDLGLPVRVLEDADVDRTSFRGSIVRVQGVLDQTPDQNVGSQSLMLVLPEHSKMELLRATSHQPANKRQFSRADQSYPSQETGIYRGRARVPGANLRNCYLPRVNKPLSICTGQQCWDLRRHITNSSANRTPSGISCGAFGSHPSRYFAPILVEPQFQDSRPGTLPDPKEGNVTLSLSGLTDSRKISISGIVHAGTVEDRVFSSARRSEWRSVRRERLGPERNSEVLDRCAFPFYRRLRKCFQPIP